jgi:hypothetical protein
MVMGRPTLGANSQPLNDINIEGERKERLKARHVALFAQDADTLLTRPADFSFLDALYWFFVCNSGLSADCSIVTLSSACISLL